MPNSSSRKTCYWIREGKSFSSNGNRTVRKGFRFQFPVAYKNSNFRLDWYALRVPVFTKAFSCPPNLDQWKLLEVKQLVWVQNRPFLKYEIQIKWPFSAHRFIIHSSTYPSHDLLENDVSNEIITPGAREEATQSSWKKKKSSLFMKYIFIIRLFSKACVKIFVIIRIHAREIPEVNNGLLKLKLKIRSE